MTACPFATCAIADPSNMAQMRADVMVKILVASGSIRNPDMRRGGPSWGTRPFHTLQGSELERQNDGELRPCRLNVVGRRRWRGHVDRRRRRGHINRPWLNIDRRRRVVAFAVV